MQLGTRDADVAVRLDAEIELCALQIICAVWFVSHAVTSCVNTKVNCGIFAVVSSLRDI